MNIQIYHGETALIIAPSSNALRCIQILIQAGADVNVRDRSDITPLLVAIGHSHFDCAECLLRAGADVNIQDYGGNSAVLIAVIKGNVEWTEKLIQAGADVNIQDTDRKTALLCAARLGHQKCLDILIQARAHMQLTDSSGGTALHALAGYCSDDKCFETLIKAGVDVNLKNRQGDTALTLAALTGDNKYLKILLNSGAKLNRENDFLPAAISGSPKCIRILLEAGADVNVMYQNGNSVLYTLLHLLTDRDQTRLTSLRLILAAGADVNIQNREGKTVVERFLKWDDRWQEEYRLTILRLLYTAGEMIGEATEKVRNLLSESESEVCLKHLCRGAIRKHLLELDPSGNLFVRVPRLGLPAVLCDYLLYNLSLDVDDSDDHEHDYDHYRGFIWTPNSLTLPRPTRYRVNNTLLYLP